MLPSYREPGSRISQLCNLGQRVDLSFPVELCLLSRLYWTPAVVHPLLEVLLEPPHNVRRRGSHVFRLIREVIERPPHRWRRISTCLNGVL